MFEIGNYVVNPSNGICRIADIVQLDFQEDSNARQYYLLVPTQNEEAKVYISMNGAEKRIREVMSSNEAWETIESMTDIRPVQIENDRMREQYYKDAINSCEMCKLIGAAKTMYGRRMKRDQEGKKLTAVDERYSKLVENAIYSELAFALGKSQSEMPELIELKLNQIEEA